jgi:outer membrane protein insertion porin family
MMFRSVLVAVVLAASAAAAGTPVRPWEDRTIERIDVHGNRAVSAADVRAALASRPGTKFHAETLEADVRALWKLGKFADVQIEGDVSPSGALALTVVVTERAAIGKAIVAGNHALADAAVLDVIDLGATLDLNAVQTSREHVLELYRSEGYLAATAAYQIVPAGKDRVDVRFVIDEKHRVSVHDLRFAGNHGATAAELRAELQTRRGETFRQEVFERDLLLLSAYYWDRGYANVRVGEPTRTLSPDGRTIDITIPVEEGPTFTISGVHATGELLDSAKDTLHMLKVRPGNLFSRTVIATDRELLSTRYQDEGYADAEVLPLTKVDLPHRTIDLTFEVKRGVVTSFEHVYILGNTTTPDSTIRNALVFREGDPFSETALEISKKRLEALGIFDQVVVSTKHTGGAPELVDVNIEITEHTSPAAP